MKNYQLEENTNSEIYEDINDCIGFYKKVKEYFELNKKARVIPAKEIQFEIYSKIIDAGSIIIKFLNFQILYAKMIGQTSYIWTPFNSENKNYYINEKIVDKVIRKFEDVGYYCIKIANWPENQLKYEIYWDYTQYLKSNPNKAKVKFGKDYMREIDIDPVTGIIKNPSKL